MAAVERWFGPGFARLHPLLQRLHRHGGHLRGTVELGYGSGLAGYCGRRLARRMGVPDGTRRIALEVRIRSDEDALYWDRRFGDGAPVRSTFRPAGRWPDGVWIESTGPLRLALTVDTTGGAWRWRHRALWYRGLRLPLAWAPRVEAAKAILDGRYAFRVEVSLPLLGPLLSYSGTLQAEYAHAADPA